MPSYTPKVTSIDPGQVGTLYNIAIGDGTRIYGYIFQARGAQSTGIKEDTNTQDRDKLIQISSPNVIDRDLTTGLPRVTQGDFSGGGLQTVFLDATKYFDSDLEIRTPGYLTLRPAWARSLLVSGSIGQAQSVPWQGDIFTTFGGASFYSSAGFATTPTVLPKFLATDGFNLFYGDGVNNIGFDNAAGFHNGQVCTTTGNFLQMWSVVLGTAGRWVYFIADNPLSTLKKVDTTSGTAQPAVTVPTGEIPMRIIDLCVYQTGVAILSVDSTGAGSDVWFHDGNNMTRITRLEQYVAVGITVCLGNLYVTAKSYGDVEGPVLIQIQAASVNVVARFSAPIVLANSASIGAPATSGQYVFFALTNPEINYVTNGPYVAIYDALTAAISHLPVMDGLDSPQTSQPRQITAAGRAVAFPMTSGINAYLQYQTDQNVLPAGNVYRHSGQMVTSRLDFGTPALTKRLRAVGVIHAPLLAGESVQLTAYPDGDQFHLGATPAVVGTPNTTVGSTTTILGFDSTICKTVYATMQIGAGTTGGTDATTPNVILVWFEIQDTWTWTFDLDATYLRRTIQQAPDGQGVTGKDLYWLLRNAWEQGTELTLYLAEGLTYQVQVDSMSAQSIAYTNHQGPEGGPVLADQEWLINQLILKQVA